MTAALNEIVAAIEQQGGSLGLTDAGQIRYSLPATIADSTALLHALREHRAELAEYLRNRSEPVQQDQERGRSKADDYERRFGQPHARLFPLLGRKVRTPKGPGTLLQAFADRATVLLDSELEKCSWFRPDDISEI